MDGVQAHGNPSLTRRAISVVFHELARNCRFRWTFTFGGYVHFAGSPELRCDGSETVEPFFVTPADTARTRKFVLNLEAFFLSPVDLFVFKIGADEVVPIPTPTFSVSETLNQRGDLIRCSWRRFASKKAV